MFNSASLARKLFKHLLEDFYNLEKQAPGIASLQQLIDQHVGTSANVSASLDLGCGLSPNNPFQATSVFGVDIRPDRGDDIRYADLAREAIPFGDAMFDFCTAIDVLEHIPRVLDVNGKSRFCLIELMNEIHRVLKPCAYFAHLTPAYPAKEAFQDPTHVNFITEATMAAYFCGPNPLATSLGYGFSGRFELIAQGWVANSKLASLMRAV